MQQDLVSILTPYKNTALFLKECLDSICAQNYTNWELLIVNDHSTDTSETIVETFAQNDPRIKHLQNNGSGIIDALRTAFEHSKGAFVTRMDSDDIMKANKLQSMTNQLKIAGPGHVALGLVNYFSEEGISEGYQKYETWLNALTKSGRNYQEIYKECVIPSPCWMLHREDLIACGAFNHDRYPEDYDLTFRFYQHQLKCLPSHELLHLWRDYPNRTSRNHEHYAQNHFLELKLHYFLKLHHDSTRPLSVWGAGTKGKMVANYLLERDVDFYWICDNPKKIGKHIYGKLMRRFDYLEELKKPQSIVTVANPQAQIEIKDYFEKEDLQAFKDYFFFC